MSTETTSPPPTTTKPKGGAHKKGKPLQFNPAAEVIRAVHLPLVIGASQATIARWRDDKTMKFPVAIQLGTRSVGFRRSDLAAWLESRTHKEGGR